jgi:pimeloyl-ACP methyl ester carboxylesterase
VNEASPTIGYSVPRCSGGVHSKEGNHSACPADSRGIAIGPRQHEAGIGAGGAATGPAAATTVNRERAVFSNALSYAVTAHLLMTNPVEPSIIDFQTALAHAISAGTGIRKGDPGVATYVLVHGGGHGGWCWQRLAPLLTGAGHVVYAPTLTGLGERVHLLNPDVDLDTHITDIVGVLHYEDLSDVILVGHSYGGMVISGVADRALGRVGHLVYLDAARPRDGESMLDVAPRGLMEEQYRSHRVVDGVDLVLFPGSDPLGYFGVTDPETIGWMRPKLSPHPWKTFAQPIRMVNQAAVDQIPRTNVNCTSTLRIREEQGGTVERAREADRVWEIDTGHDLMITEPQAVADMLLRIALVESRR